MILWNWILYFALAESRKYQRFCILAFNHFHPSLSSSKFTQGNQYKYCSFTSQPSFTCNFIWSYGICMLPTWKFWLINKFPANHSTKYRSCQGLRSSSVGMGISSGYSGMVGKTNNQSKVEAKYPALLFKQHLAACIEKLFGMIRDNLKKEISPFLHLCIQVKTKIVQSKPKKWKTITF